MKFIKYFLILATFVGFLSGCAATGSSFVAVEPGPDDMGVVYFYRPKAFVGGGNSLMLVDNGKQISRIKNGHFIRYLATPGQHKFHTNTIAIDKAVAFNVEAGKNYYIRTGLRQGMWVGTWYLSRVFEDEAIEELKTCCKSGKKN